MNYKLAAGRVVGWFMMIMSLVGCYQRSSTKTPFNEIVLFLPGEPFSLDPRIGGEARSQLLTRELFEGLMRYGKTGEPELAIAASVDLSEDAKTYTFHLRPSKWSNGEALTAPDFEYAWKSVICSKLPSKFAYAFFVIKNARKASKKECPIDDVGITSLDDVTLQVTLEHPAPFFLQWTANPIYSPVCRTVVDKIDNWSNECFPGYVCNGPFVLKEHLVNSHIVLEKNPFYWNTDGAKSDRLRFSIVAEPTTAYNLYKSGDLDWFGFPCITFFPTEITTNLLKEGSLHSSQKGETVRMDCCVQRPHLASSKVRKALAQAINRKELANQLFCGGDLPATSVVPNWLSLLPAPLFEDGNPEIAKKLFEEGIAELGYTRASYPSLVISSDIRYKQINEVIAQQIQTALKIPVRSEVIEEKVLMDRAGFQEYELSIRGWVTWLQDPIYNLESFKYKNNRLMSIGWQNDEYINLLDSADATANINERTNLLRQAETLFLTEMPAIPLLYISNKYAKAPDVIGEEFFGIGSPELKWLERKNTTDSP